jgi:hypothetical protein
LGRNCLLKHFIEGMLDGRIEMMGRRTGRRKSSYWMTSRKREGTVNWKRKH